MATVKEINHDASTVVANSYTTSIVDPDSAVTITIGAALNGSTNGVDCDFDAGSNIPNLVEAFAFAATQFRWRIRVKMDNLSSVGSGTPCDIILEDGAGGDEFRITITSDTSPAVNSYKIELSYKPDVGGLISIGQASLPSVGDICIEVRAIRETGASAADGEVELFVGGVSKQNVANAENFATFTSIAQARLRFGSNSVNLSGNMFYDEFIISDDNTANLGCPQIFSGYDLVQGGGKP
jgi:hypothetical protein